MLHVIVVCVITYYYIACIHINIYDLPHTVLDTLQLIVHKCYLSCGFFVNEKNTEVYPTK